MIIKRLKNLWRLSAYEPVNGIEPLQLDDDVIIAKKIRPVKKAQIIRKISKIDEFLKN